MGSTKCTRLVLDLSFLVVLIALNFRTITSYTPRETLHRQTYMARLTTISSFEPGMNLLERENVSEPTRHLADTVRVDPLDKFKKYRGGYDITNKHYWSKMKNNPLIRGLRSFVQGLIDGCLGFTHRVSSTVFTGIYGYAIGVVWLLCGMIYGGFLLATTLCCKKEEKKLKRLPCSRQCYLWPILFGASFTILAIVASGTVLGGSSRFHSRAKTVMNIIIKTADDASDTIYNVTGAMRDIRDNLRPTDEAGEAFSFLNSTSQTLDNQAAELSRQAKKNRRLINKGLKIVYITTTIAISLNLIAAIALSVSGFLKLRRAFYLFIVLCWLLAVLGWVSFGLYFFLEKFAGDTCTALEDFQQDPHNNSLTSILPCDELLSAKSVLLDTRVGIYNFVNQVNANISGFQASSIPNLIQVCNPFSAPPDYHYQPENCPANTIRIGDIPQVLKIFTCSNGDAGNCKEGEFISTSDFETVQAYTRSIQNLLNAFPGMESLVDCQTVKDAFTEILSKHCKPLKKYVRMVWAAMVVLSTIMVILVLIWATKAHHDKKRHFSDGSVKPHSLTANKMESDITKAGVYQSEIALDP